ncbi:MAG: TetR/AcrR family transcriptional regulator [Acidimicrobiales bacterium]
MTLAITSRSPGRPRDQAATRAITDAALRQLMDVGYGRLSMESVASEAGVARATVYRRFKDKADLVTAAIALHAGPGSTTDPSGDPRADLERFLVEFDDRFNRSCIEVLGGLLADREDPRALALHRQRVIAPRKAYARSLLERARELGELDRDADVDLALDMLVGAVIARAVSGDESRERWAERALDSVWRGMGPRQDARTLRASGGET